MTIEILPYSAERAPVFDRLNREWISHYFSIEPMDDLVLTQPEKYILTPGGEIWFAALDGNVVGACALLVLEENLFEFTKLGVDQSARGNGVARALLRHCIARSKTHGHSKLRIFTNSKLGPACALYRSENFIEVPMSDAERKRYKRADVMFDLAL